MATVSNDSGVIAAKNELIEALPTMTTANLKALETKVATEHVFRFVSKDTESMKVLKEILTAINAEFKTRT